jgi:hypothetical protein
MQAITARVPASLPADASEVVEALRVATTFWEKGNHADAIQWVKRAVAAADQAGDAARTAALARSVADLEQSAIAPRPRTVPPSSRPPPASSRMPASKPPPLPPRAMRSVPPPAAAPALPTISEARIAPTLPAPTLPTVLPALAPVRPPEMTNPEVRVRVSVKTSVRDPQLLVVRRLADGESPPPGAREAWLVLPEGES